MSSANIKRVIPCKKDDLIKMVLDIEKYPEFVPWCLEGKIYEKKELADLIEMKGDLKVGKKFLNQTYTSFVVYHKKDDIIIVKNIDGPLKYLKNTWKFKEINYSTHLEFDIDFKLNNYFLNKIMENSFNMGLNKIADAFEKRATDLYGKQ